MAVYHRPPRDPTGSRPSREARIDPSQIPARDVVLYVALVTAAIVDARSQKIPNWLTFALMVVALVVQVTPAGAGISFALLGLVVAFVLHFALWQLGMEGAGDAKLMMGVGAFVGWETMLEATLWRYVLLLPYAVLTLTVKRRWGNFLAALRWTLYRAQGAPVGERPEPTYMPFGPLIAIAVPLAMHTEWLAFF